jgi:DNA-binding NtrC family response regulator
VTSDTASSGWVTQSRGGVPVRVLPKLRLKVTRGKDKGAAVELAGGRLRVGAMEGNDLVLSDGAVSRHHFEIAVTPRGPLLRDLDSRNGTVVRGLHVREAWLQAGDKIEVGDSVLVLEAAGGEAEVAASASERFGPLWGRSVVMRELFAELERIAPATGSVLITGETGTGKELIAEALVEAGSRASKPLVVIDCGAISPSLIESELFGHEKGAFTGAVAAHAGAFERADGGTVFLDEIGELPVALQPKLLRVLERREVQRVGGNAPIKIDVRLLCATHRRLEEEVNRGHFRADLFYRLSVFTVRAPPLRERADDIPLLAEQFLRSIPGATAGPLDAAVLERLCAHPWPGNVRELRNAVERIAFGSSPLPGANGAAGQGPIDLDTPFRRQKDALVEGFERRYAQALLEWSGGNAAKAARRAGLDRMAVVKLFARHALSRQR